MNLPDSLRKDGVLSESQAARLSEIESGRLISLQRELRLLMYLGALFIVVGVGATVKRFFSELGPLSILGALSSAVAAAFYYCFRKGRPFSHSKAESPFAAFDYILFLGCAFLGIEFGYIESHFHLLKNFWDYYLLASACFFFFLAYRFDNRLVLAMAIINLGGWMGLRLNHFGLGLDTLKWPAIIYAALLAAAGEALRRTRLKEHFTDAYFTFALNIACVALLAGVLKDGFACPEFLLLAALTAAVIYCALERKRFDYFLYAVVYGYIGFSSGIIRLLGGASAVALYLLVSAAAVMFLIFQCRRILEQKT